MEHDKTAADPDPGRNCESDMEVEYDSISLPPPRRSQASRYRPRTLSTHRIVAVLKWSFALLVVLFVLYLIRRDMAPPPADVELPRELTILLWNDGKPRNVWNNCQWRCMITTNPKYFNRTIDAVIVNADQPYTLKGITEVNQSPNFLLIFAASKPLNKLHNPLLEYGEATFNYTMTYRSDSDLVLRNYYFSKLDSVHEPVQKFDPQDHQFNENLSKAQFQFVRDKLLLKKKGTLLITQEDNDYTLFHSRFLQQMRQYVDITTLSSSRADNITSYMFMLVFDSTSCPDYVHPHVYLALSNFIVPVVIGGSNVRELIPPGSYIDGNQYQPRKLAEYLIDARGALYEHFFWWHAKYQLHQIRQPYCALCDQLRHKRKQRKHKSFQRWWRKYKCPERTE